MEALYAAIERNGLAATEKMVAERAEEGGGLDFKEKVDPSHGRATKVVRQAPAENLSAFANCQCVFGAKNYCMQRSVQKFGRTQIEDMLRI